MNCQHKKNASFFNQFQYELLVLSYGKRLCHIIPQVFCTSL